MNKLLLPVLIGVGCIGVNSTLVAATFFGAHAQGWHWYESNPEGAQPTKQSSATPTATTQMQQLRREVEEQLNQAVLNPTPQNVERYITLQNTLTRKASQFAQTWQTVLTASPDLNYSLQRPTNQYAQQVYRANQTRQDQSAIKQFAQQYGLFFFVSSSCPYCHAFAPTVKTIAERYGISVLVVSLDGQGLPDFPMVLPNNGVAERFGVRAVPALFAVHRQTSQATPLAFGVISAAELETNIAQLARSTQQQAQS